VKKSVNFETMKAHGLTHLTLLLNVYAVHVCFHFWSGGVDRFYFCPIVKCKVSYTYRGFLTPYFSVLSFGFKSNSSCTGKYLIGSIPDIAFCPAAPAAELSPVPGQFPHEKLPVRPLRPHIWRVGTIASVPRVQPTFP